MLSQRQILGDASARLTPTSPMADASLRAFSLWLKREGALLEGAKLKSGPNGTGVFATRALDADAVVAAVPETAVLERFHHTD